MADNITSKELIFSIFEEVKQKHQWTLIRFQNHDILLKEFINTMIKEMFDTGIVLIITTIIIIFMVILSPILIIVSLMEGSLKNISKMILNILGRDK